MPPSVPPAARDTRRSGRAVPHHQLRKPSPPISPANCAEEEDLLAFRWKRLKIETIVRSFLYRDKRNLTGDRTDPAGIAAAVEELDMGRKAGSSGARTHDAIRAAGLELIRRHGYEGMSLRQLAAEIGLQQGSLYNHISTKQDLLMELLRGHMQDLLTALNQALAGIDDPLARLRAFIAFHLHYHMTRQAEVFVINFELRSLEPDNYAEIIALRQQYEKTLADILALGMRRKLIRKTDIPVTTYALLAMLTGICTWYQPEGRLNEKQLIELHTELVFKGLVSEAF